jgi:glycerol-3-phosphate dehydrogenase subunit B
VPSRVVVIGAGAAGTAAAWCAAQRGAQVTLLDARSGSSSLGSGAVDFDWDQPAAARELVTPLEAEAREFVAALDLWQLGPTRIATRQGVLRQTRGADRSLLDVEPLAGLRVAVCDVARDDWDGAALAASYASSDWARRTGTEFVAVAVDALRQGAERRISPYDFALLHDHPERLSWLAGLLRGAAAGVDAWLLGPWLGSDISVAARLRAELNVPLGEASSAPGGAAGARFDRARDRVLAAAGVTRRSLQVLRVESAGTEWRIWGEHSELVADAVVLAVGGVAAGGIELAVDHELGSRGFRLAIDAPVRVTVDGELAGEASSLFGPTFGSGFGALERVGVELTSTGLVRSATGGATPGLAAAGDCVAGRPRSLLEAVRAGTAAARAVLSSS